MRHFAHIENGKVYALSSSPNLIIEIPEEDSRLMGTVYNELEKVFEGYRITLTTDKAQREKGGEDTTDIVATITTWDDEPAIAFEGEITFEVDGTEISAVVSNGEAVFEFASNEVGTYEIKTVNEDDTILSN